MRGIESGIDPRINDHEVATFVAGKIVARVRGTARRLPQAYLGRHVVLVNRSKLTVGRGVSIGRGVLIDAMCEDGIVLSDSSTIDINAVIRCLLYTSPSPRDS